MVTKSICCWLNLNFVVTESTFCGHYVNILRSQNQYFMQSNDVLGNYVNFFIVTDFGKKIEMTKSNKAGSGPGIIKSLFLKIWEI